MHQLQAQPQPNSLQPQVQLLLPLTEPQELQPQPVLVPPTEPQPQPQPVLVPATLPLQQGLQQEFATKSGNQIPPEVVRALRALQELQE